MNLDHTVTLAADPERTWRLIRDIPAVSRCVPGVETVAQVEPDTYDGALKVSIGPIKLTLQGRVRVVELDDANHRSILRVTATDRRIPGSVDAVSTMQLVPNGAETDLQIKTDAAIVGKLGEFGQPVMRRKADQLVKEFADNVARELASQLAGGAS